VEERVVEFVLELAAPDGLAAATSAGGVTALEHEAGDDAVEDDAVVLAGVGEAGEVLACLCGTVRRGIVAEWGRYLRGFVAVQGDGDVAVIGRHEDSGGSCLRRAGGCVGLGCMRGCGG